MNPTPIPANALASAFPTHQAVRMGPPAGVSDDDCGTVEMLIGQNPSMPGFAGHDQIAYFKPTEDELAILNAGGYLVMNQLGTVVQPFSLGVWPAPDQG